MRQGRDGVPTAVIPEKWQKGSVVPPGLARHEMAVNRFVRDAVMPQAVPSRSASVPYRTDFAGKLA